MVKLIAFVPLLVTRELPLLQSNATAAAAVGVCKALMPSVTLVTAATAGVVLPSVVPSMAPPVTEIAVEFCVAIDPAPLCAVAMDVPVCELNDVRNALSLPIHSYNHDSHDELLPVVALPLPS